MADQVIGVARIDIEANAGGVEVAVARAKSSIASMSKDAQAQYSKLSAAEKRRVDSLIRQSDTIGMTRAQQLAYNAALKSSGPLLDDITRRLKANESAAQKAGNEFNKYGLTAKMELAALRQVPAQITDIIVSLQGGQRPLTVLLQQGGQLKDVFGGVVPAVKALSGALLGMINPATLSLGALVALGAAWYQGSREMDEINKRIIMTGNSLGVTTSQIALMAQQLDGLDGVTRGGAVKALAEVAKSGKVAGDQLSVVAEVAVKANQLIGREVSEVVEEFAKLAEEPTKASAKLNQEYGYLTQSVYEQIRALEDQGRTQEAAKLAQEAYAEVTNRRLDEVRDSLGYLEIGWNSVWGAAKDAWDMMKGIGRAPSLQEQLEVVEGQLEAARKTIADSEAGILPDMRGYESTAVERARMTLLRREALQLAVAQEQANASLKAHDTQNNKDRQVALDRWERQEERIRSNAEKREKEIKQARRDAILLGKSDKELQEQIAAIEEKYKDKQGKSYSNDEATRRLLLLREQGAALQAQAESSIKLGSHQQALAKFEREIADIKEKKILTAGEKSLLLNEGDLRIQYEKNAALEREAEIKKAMNALEDRSAQMTLQMLSARESANEQYQRMLDSFGLGDKTMERVQAQRAIYKEFQKRQEEWTKLAAKSGLLESDIYKRTSQEIENELKRRLAGAENYYKTEDELRQSWALGASHGLANYADEAADVFSSVSSLATQSFKGMEDAIVKFATTGKLSFYDFANSVIQDMLRISVQQSVTKPLAGFLTGVVGGLVGGGASSGNLTGSSLFGSSWGPSFSLGGGSGGLSGIGTLPFSFDTGGFTGHGGRNEPAGIVHKGEGVLNADEIRAIGGEAGFDALRRAIRGERHAIGGMAGSPSTVQALTARPLRAPNVVINNNGTPQNYDVQSWSYEEIVLIADDRVKRNAPKAVAASLGQNNSVMRKAVGNNFNTTLRRR